MTSPVACYPSRLTWTAAARRQFRTCLHFVRFPGCMHRCGGSVCDRNYPSSGGVCRVTSVACTCRTRPCRRAQRRELSNAACRWRVVSHRYHGRSCRWRQADHSVRLKHKVVRPWSREGVWGAGHRRFGRKGAVRFTVRQETLSQKLFFGVAVRAEPHFERPACLDGRSRRDRQLLPLQPGETCAMWLSVRLRAIAERRSVRPRHVRIPTLTWLLKFRAFILHKGGQR